MKTAKLLTIALAVAIGAPIMAGAASAPKSAADIKAYCARARNTEASREDDLYPAEFPTLWRCMNGSVYTCEVGASGRGCAKAGHSKAPTAGVLNWCRENPNSDFVPGAYLSNAAITWKCNGRRPVIVDTEPVDERGYLQNAWHKVGP